MSLTGKVDTRASSKIITSPSSRSCSHCGSLFIHSKGCRYCLPTKNRPNAPLSADNKNPKSNGKKGILRHCVVPCCTNATGKKPKKNFFFPTVGNERRKLWLKAVGVKRFRPQFAICEDHFELEADLENFIKYKYYPSKWNKLKKTAIPAKFPCRTGKGGSYPKHEHIFKDLIRTKGAKKEYPSGLLESGDVKNQKVVASGAIPSSKFGHPPELRSPALAQVEIVCDEPEKSESRKDTFDFLNGDISNLIAHVQPNICSWDVSVIDVNSPGLSACKDTSCSKSSVEVVVVNVDDAESVVSSGGDVEGEPQTDNEDDTTEMKQENEKNAGTMTLKTEQIDSITTTVEKSEVEPQLSETEDADVEESEEKQNSLGLESSTSDESTGGPQLPEKVEMAFEQPSVRSKPVAVEVTGSVISTADDNQNAPTLCEGQQCISSGVENGEQGPEVLEKSVQEKSGSIDDARKSSLPPSRVQTAVTSSNDTASDIEPAAINSARSTPEKGLLNETQDPTAIDDETAALDMECESVSDDPASKIDSNKVQSPEKVLVPEAKPNSTPLANGRTGRISKANCSCVMCGGISDVAEDDSDVDDPSTLSQTSPKAGTNQTSLLMRENGLCDSSKVEANPTTRATSSETDEGGRESILAAQAPSIPMKRILKKVEQLSDSSDVTEDDSPEAIESDSDSEWAPSEEEVKYVRTRTTRSSTKLANVELTRRTRNSNKSESTHVDSFSPSKTVDTTSKRNDEVASSSAKRSSLVVNMKESVASYSLKKTGTTYSYKQLYERGESNEETAPAKCSDKVLVVRDKGSDEFNDKEGMPQPMVDLLENMKTYFDHFFEKLDKLKEKIAKPGATPSSLDLANKSGTEENRLAEKYVETLEEDVKMFPALLNVEMVQFVLKCKQHYQDNLDDMGERFKKIRWCNSCSVPALFHCCFKAAYCSTTCQKNHWDEHRKECAQEHIGLVDPHLRLNPTLMLRVKNLNKSKFTLSDLEKSSSNQNRTGQPQKSPQAEQVCKNTEKNGRSNDERPKTSLLLGKRKSLNDRFQRTGFKTYPPKQKPSNSTPKANGSLDQLERVGVKTESVDLTTDVPVKRKRNTPVGANANTFSKTSVLKKMNGTYRSKLPVNRSQAVNITLSPQLVSSLSGSSVQLNNGTYTVAASTASKATLPSGNLLMPKPTSQVVVKFRTVTLPSGEKRLVPADMPVDQNFAIRTNSSPSTGKPSTSGSILITRSGNSTYTAHTGFIPLTQVTSSSTQPLILQQGVDGILTPVANPMFSQPPNLSMVPPLPTLTPIPKQGSCSIRTLNDEELNKILNTDHLQTAFDDSYYANTRIRS